ncbi:MAG: accessory factor UbiK family protein [Bdellovibrionales bacterium]
MPISRDEPKLIEDLMTMGGNLLGAAFGARHEWGAQARERMETLAHRLNIVSREEFEAAREMIAKARDMQEDLNERLSVIESRLGIAANRKGKEKAQAATGKQKTNGKTIRSSSVKKNKRASTKA